MAVLQFSERQYCKTFNTDETIYMGGIKPAVSGELFYIRVRLYIDKSADLGGSERLRLNVCSDKDVSKVMYTSSWTNFSDISNNTGTNWWGWLRITFNYEILNKNIWYYLSAEINNYTRNGDTHFCGLCRDFDNPVYTPENGGAL